jgi:hypothetical protein
VFGPIRRAARQTTAEQDGVWGSGAARPRACPLRRAAEANKLHVTEVEMSDATKTAKSRTRAKVKAHRARLRAQGLRPIQIWVPDTSAPGFAEEMRRQCRLANESPHAKDDQDFVDSISWLNTDEAW